MGMQSQNISKYSPKVNFEIHIHWNLQYLIFQLLEGFGAKTVCSCKNGHLNCQNTNILYRSPNFKSFFLKSTFHQSVMIPSMKLPYLKNAMSNFKTFCSKIELKEQLLRKQQDFNLYLLRQLVPFDVLSHKYVSVNIFFHQ